MKLSALKSSCLLIAAGFVLSACGDSSSPNASSIKTGGDLGVTSSEEAVNYEGQEFMAVEDESISNFDVYLNSLDEQLGMTTDSFSILYNARTFAQAGGSIGNLMRSIVSINAQNPKSNVYSNAMLVLLDGDTTQSQIEFLTNNRTRLESEKAYILENKELIRSKVEANYSSSLKEAESKYVAAKEAYNQSYHYTYTSFTSAEVLKSERAVLMAARKEARTNLEVVKDELAQAKKASIDGRISEIDQELKFIKKTVKALSAQKKKAKKAAKAP